MLDITRGGGEIVARHILSTIPLTPSNAYEGGYSHLKGIRGFQYIINPKSPMPGQTGDFMSCCQLHSVYACTAAANAPHSGSSSCIKALEILALQWDCVDALMDAL